MFGAFCMCWDNECPSRAICERHEASGTNPEPLQGWTQFWRKGKEAGLFEEDKCSGYMPKSNEYTNTDPK